MAFLLRKAFDSDIKKIKPHAERFNLDTEGLEPLNLYIAEKNGNLAGFGRYKNYGDFYEISTLGVLENFRNLGLGKMMVKKLTDSAPSKKIWLTTIIPVYFEKFGFKISDNVPEQLILKTKKICKKFNKNVKFNVYMKKQLF